MARSVTLREIEGKKWISFLLDMNIDGKREKRVIKNDMGKTLKIYKYPKTAEQKAFNEKITRQAKLAHNQIEKELLAGTYSYIDEKDYQKGSFIAFVEILTDQKKGMWIYTLRVIKEYNPNLVMKDITKQEVEKIKAFLIKKYSSLYTSATHFSNIKSAIRLAFEQGIIDSNPASLVKNISKGKSSKEYMTIEEIKLIMSVPYKTRYHYKKCALFAFYTGLRISDLLELKWEHIDLQNQIIKKVLFKTRNSKKQKSIIVIADEAIGLLGELKEPNEYVFCLGQDKEFTQGNKSRGDQVTDALKRMAKKVGLNKKIGIHTFRYSHATELTDMNVDRVVIQENLAHSKPETTAIYAKVKLRNRFEAVNKLPKIEIGE